MRIFVQIAAYRDNLLVSTVQDLLQQAKFPDRCRVVICNQYHADDPFYAELDKLRGDARIELLDIPWHASRGVCWARNLIQQQYKGEEYTLQIDAHMRFVTHWDEILVEMIKQLQAEGYAKPVLSTYPPHFDPESFTETIAPANRINLVGFNEEGLPDCWPDSIPGWEKLTRPVPARFMAGGFSFTIGSFCTEVPHDPELYFWGEEINLAVRAYTNGYDLFHPHRNVIWHNYSRNTAPKHWNDAGRVHNITFYKLARLFDETDTDAQTNWGIFGLGQQRSLRNYEQYAGIRLSQKKAQPGTLQRLPPPMPAGYASEQEWEESFACITRETMVIPLRAVSGSLFSDAIIRFFSDNHLAHEWILTDAQLEQLRSATAATEITVSFSCACLPDHWQLLVYETGKGWQPACNGTTSMFSRSLGGFFMNNCLVM